MKDYQCPILKGIPAERTQSSHASPLVFCLRLDSSRPRASTPKSSSTTFRRRQLPVAKNNNSWAKSHSKYPGPKSSAAGDDRLAATGTRTEGKEKFRKGRCHSCSVTFALTAFLLALGPRSCEHVIPICQHLPETDFAPGSLERNLTVLQGGRSL